MGRGVQQTLFFAVFFDAFFDVSVDLQRFVRVQLR
jgi:hypothetical protein